MIFDISHEKKFYLFLWFSTLINEKKKFFCFIISHLVTSPFLGGLESVRIHGRHQPEVSGVQQLGDPGLGAVTLGQVLGKEDHQGPANLKRKQRS